MNYSKWTGDDLTAIDLKISDAQKNWQKAVDDYNWGVQNGSKKYAENTRKPRVVSAKAILDTLTAQKTAMLTDMSKAQTINLAKPVSNKVTTVNETKNETKIPWGKIGLAIATVAVIVIIILVSMKKI
jgi:hypothetical protein